MTRARLIFILAGVALLAGIIASRWWAPSGSLYTGEGVIEMTAENFKFTPRVIRVKEGTRVRIHIRSLDDDHGIAFKIVPAGQPEDSPPGLRFATSHPDWILKKGTGQNIEFVAERRGTYEFSCSVFCGMGHNGMLGRILVE